MDQDFQSELSIKCGKLSVSSLSSCLVSFCQRVLFSVVEVWFVYGLCVCRVFVDVVNGEPVPRKSILKSRSRENSICSDTSESSTADFEERRAFFGRTLSHDDATHSDASDGIMEEDSPTSISLYPNGRFEVYNTCVF